ncbi:lysophospholipid acyltransferase family protein [Labrys monachus]|uniref:1-acyl-sn-glycerol-3-phosphate acyltransferase n=1 Tax=Labrys monachus TaxID=217067 RepID=A0ABU0FNS8_9HYPH|nr:lysophospholipid acyltransferase family protein [Labrys monachus]MDQ0396263.1 1-acyl-sn-glycerol-3-phosphate acyltransferase [Labrys monachus]
MLILRSLLFNLLYYVNIVVWMVAVLPTFALPRRVLLRAVKAWARTNLFLMRHVAGITCEIRGRENIPPGPLLVACKHQSVWETFALFLVFDDPCYILKRELMWLPLFGWLAAKQRMIAVDRGARSRAMRQMQIDGRRQLADGRQIVIFPEGTRRAPGAEPAYKYGVVYLYSEFGVPCVPVALNSGVFWPRRQFIRRPGRLVLEILPPLAPGEDKAAFFDRLQAVIETASARLLAEAGAQPADVAALGTGENERESA